MAATSRLRRLQQALLVRAAHHGGLRRTTYAHAARLLGALLGPLAGPHGHAAELPADRADLMYHRYEGGGTTSDGPALLVRKSLLDRVSLSASYYVDMVSNASIDVVTMASPYSERRTETGLGLDYSVRSGLLSLSASKSDEPDYKADAVNFDLQQETFGGMTTVNLGFSRGSDKVGRVNEGFFDEARHWRYRLGVTQILTRRYLASLNAEVVSDDGYLGSPYRSALVFGAPVPERVPRTRTGRAVNLRLTGAEGSGAVRFDYRYYWDTWDIRSHTFETAMAGNFGDQWIGELHLRYYKQSKALFYSDNAMADTLYVSRNRQLGTFDDVGVGAKLTYNWLRLSETYEIKLTGAIERVRFNFSDFTDLRTGLPYTYDATILQLFATATF